MAKFLFKYVPPPDLRGLTPPDGQDALDPESKKRATDRWWFESSYDLRRGLDVDDAGDTVPGDLLDELFKQ